MRGFKHAADLNQPILVLRVLHHSISQRERERSRSRSKRVHTLTTPSHHSHTLTHSLTSRLTSHLITSHLVTPRHTALTLIHTLTLDHASPLTYPLNILAQLLAQRIPADDKVQLRQLNERGSLLVSHQPITYFCYSSSLLFYIILYCFVLFCFIPFVYHVNLDEEM